MNRPFRALLLALTFALAACGQDNSEPASSQVITAADIPAKQVPSIEASRKFAQGFDTGNLASTRQVIVFFDPQCPHCGMFWSEAIKLSKDVRFTWVPVAILNRNSLKQGAAILSSQYPVARMTEHESKLMSGAGGLVAGEPDSKYKAIIQANTRLLDSFGATGVPFIVSVNAQTGNAYSSSQGMPAEVLVETLGWSAAGASAPVTPAQ